MDDIVNNRRKNLEKLKHLLELGKDKDIINNIEGLYINGDITTQVLIEYLTKNLSNKKIIQYIEDTDQVSNRVYKNENMPLISVIIPTYGGYLPIEQTIDSVLKQDYENIEVIVMDDAGNDITKEFIFNKYRKNNKIRYFQSKSNILSGADKRKAGLKKSYGKYIIFLDHDDYYIDSGFFRRAVSFFEYDSRYCKETDGSFSIYGSNAFLYKQYDDSYEIKYLNVSGEYSGKEYLYGFQKQYDKPLSVFPSVFVKEKLLKSGILESNILCDSIIYMYACLCGNVFISDNIIGAYRIGINASSNSVTFDRMISIIKEKKRIMLKAKKRYYGVNWNEWLLTQTKLSLNFVEQQKYPITFRELSCIELLGFIYFKEKFNECGKYFLAKYIESNTSYNSSINKKVDRLQGYYDLLNRWLAIKNRGGGINDYLIRQGWKKVCIYGYGEIGKRLYEEISQSKEITILSIIDASYNNKHLLQNVNIYSLSEELPVVDVTIITPVFAIENIKKDLRKKGIISYISIEDVLKKI